MNKLKQLWQAYLTWLRKTPTRIKVIDKYENGVVISRKYLAEVYIFGGWHDLSPHKSDFIEHAQKDIDDYLAEKNKVSNTKTTYIKYP